MDGWSSNNDSYHFGVGCTSITPRKRWRMPQCAMHADFNMTPWGTTYENIICLDCDAPHTTLTVSRARGKVSNVFTFSAYQIRDKRPSFQVNINSTSPHGRVSFYLWDDPRLCDGVQEVTITRELFSESEFVKHNAHADATVCMYW